MPPRPERSSPYRRAAWALLALAAVAVCLVFRDYGITNDEEVQSTYGRLLARFYASGFQDRSALHYFDLYRYGGLFDLSAAWLNAFSPLGEYPTRHLLGGLIGVAGLAGVWRLGRRLGGERAGWLALVLLLLTPAFVGHSFNNPKDAPFATAMIWALAAIARLLDELPKPRLATALGFGLVLGLALAIRVGAVLILPCLGFGVLLWALGCARDGRSGAIGPALWAGLKVLLPALVLAYAVMALFWPYAWQAPLNPWRVLRTFSHLPIELDTLAAGRWYPADSLPWFYLPAYVVLTLPEVVLAGLAAALGAGTAWLRRGARLDARAAALGAVAFAALFPLAVFVIARPTAYNGLRHVLFVLPPLVLLAALALERLWARCETHSHTAGRTFAAALGLLLALQAGLVVALHPQQYIYFNAFAGGVAGAHGRWEQDYWGNSLPEAVRGLETLLIGENGGRPPPHPARVAVCGNEQAVTGDLPPWLVYEEKWHRADFLIALTHDGCDRELPLPNAVVVERLGAPLAVVKDLRGHALVEHPPEAAPPPPQFQRLEEQD